MNIKINHQSQTPIYMQIKNQLKELILTGEIQDGAKLPSERALAKLADVHRNTIIKAYNELKADGLITAAQGKGYEVTYAEREGGYPAGDRRGFDRGGQGAAPKSVTYSGRVRKRCPEEGEFSSYSSNSGGLDHSSRPTGSGGYGHSLEWPEAHESKKARPKKSCTVNWSGLIKEQFQDMETTFDELFSKSYGNGNISFAAGIAAPEAYNAQDLSNILSELIKPTQNPDAAGDRAGSGLPAAISRVDDIYAYTPYQGLYELRKAISIFLQGKGINAKHSEIQIISESNQAIGYLTELLLEKGDTVITEEPISPDVFREFQLAGAKVITVPMDDEGMITDRIEPLIVKHKPKFIYVNSSFHDPTGVVMTLGRRKHLLMLSHQYGVPIIEDDGASEICFEQRTVPSLKALDRGDSVIYIYSFALTFAPGIRVAFTVAPRIVIKNMSQLISLRLVSFDSLSQRLLCGYMESGMYQNNLRKICEDYKQKRDLMCRLLESAVKLGVSFQKPKGGVYIWCKLPRRMDLGKLIERAGKKGVTFIPGNVFFPYGTKGDSYIRLNYSYPGIEQIERGMLLLLSAMKESIVE